ARGPDLAGDRGAAGDPARHGGVAPAARARAVQDGGRPHGARDAAGGERVTSGPHRPTHPKRLTVVGATHLERSLPQPARRERPSPELTARMAAGLGISAAVATTVAAAPAVAAAKTSLGAWLSAGLVAAAVTAGVVGVRMAAPAHDGARGRAARTDTSAPTP